MTTRADTAFLETAWRQLAENPGRKNHELDLSLKLPVVIGCTSECMPYIMILCGMQPKSLDGLETIDVKVGVRPSSSIGENWSLMFILKDWGLLHAFAEICQAFVERIRHAPSEHAALRQIYATVDQWRRLLKAVSGTRIDVLRGVCGELLAAFEIAKLANMPVDEVCMAWAGPYGAPQDYMFESEHRCWEIKTIHTSTKRVMISSPEQLDTSNRRINLITVVLDTATEGDDKSQRVSLLTLTERLRCAADDPYQVGICISNGLDALGLDPYSDMAVHTMFATGPTCIYEVRDGFPKVIPSMLPSGVTNLTYTIELDAIEPFIAANNNLSNTLES